MVEPLIAVVRRHTVGYRHTSYIVLFVVDDVFEFGDRDVVPLLAWPPPLRRGPPQRGPHHDLRWMDLETIYRCYQWSYLVDVDVEGKLLLSMPSCVDSAVALLINAAAAAADDVSPRR